METPSQYAKEQATQMTGYKLYIVIEGSFYLMCKKPNKNDHPFQSPLKHPRRTSLYRSLKMTQLCQIAIHL